MVLRFCVWVYLGFMGFKGIIFFILVGWICRIWLGLGFLVFIFVIGDRFIMFLIFIGVIGFIFCIIMVIFLVLSFYMFYFNKIFIFFYVVIR